MPSEKFMQQHYGANGYVSSEPKPAPQTCEHGVLTADHCKTCDPAPQAEGSRPYVVTAEQWKESAVSLEAEVTRLEAAQAPLLQKISELESALAQERDSKNTAYSERDRLVCAISKIFPSWLERHPLSDTTWEDDWRWIVFVQFPTGQASWHIHDSEESWFDHLERKNGNSWDGHSTAEKYARIERFERIGNLKVSQPNADDEEKI